MGVTRRRRMRRVTSVLSWVVALSIAVGWFVFLRPEGLGGSTGFVIVSGESMEPMMETGDLAVVREKDHYRVGDVVAYKIPDGDVGGGMMVIHRVIGGNLDEGLLLQGDNRDSKDLWRPKADDVVGSLQWHLPNVGTGLFLLRTPMVLAGVLGFLGFWFVATSGSGKEASPEAEADDLAGERTTAEPEREPVSVPERAPRRVPEPVAPRVEIVLPDVPARPSQDLVTVAVTAGVLAAAAYAGRRR